VHNFALRRSDVETKQHTGHLKRPWERL